MRPGKRKNRASTDEKSSSENDDDNVEVQDQRLNKKLPNGRCKRKRVLDKTEMEDSDIDNEDVLINDENLGDFDESEDDAVFANLVDDEDLIDDDDLISSKQSSIYTTRPQLQVGQRVKVNPASALYAGEHWTGLALETSKGWTLDTNIHGIIRRETGSGRRSIWKVQWFGPEVLPQLYEVDNPSRIYACFPHECNYSEEKKYKRILT